MPIEVSNHPDFGRRMAKFTADKQAATTAGDEAAMARADTDWANARMEMSNDLYSRAEVERERQTALARIKSENPNVPESVFANIPDLTKAEEVAKELQAAYASTPSAQRPQGQPQSWSPPPGQGGNAAPTAPTVDPNEQRDPDTGQLPSNQKRMDELSPRVLRNGIFGATAREEADELMRRSLEPITTRFNRGVRQ